jgi:predicted GIY-YIG superfamily endonuclease
MIEVDDGTLYTGVTTDVSRRFREHGQRPRGARYFAGRSPVAVVYTEAQPDRGEALRREAAIKKLKRPQKLKLLQDCIYFR